MADDITTNKSLARHGADDIERTCHTSGQLKVLTHCNAGSLATVGYGTALGQLIDQSLHSSSLSLVYPAFHFGGYKFN